MFRVECGVSGVGWKVERVECGVWSVKRGWGVKCKCGV